MASLVLGVLGLKRSGKDTFASRLVEAHGFTRFAFADALKATMRDLNPMVRIEHDEVGALREATAGTQIFHGGEFARLGALVDFAGWEAAKEVREVRRLLQEHGVAIRNHVAEEVWVDAVRDRVNATDGPVVITDVRFPNEIDYVEDHPNGFTVRVVRPGQVSLDTHVSEVALAEAETDEVVLNDGTIADLHEKADRAARFLTSPYSSV